MFPSAPNPSPPPDSRWASAAFDGLSEGLGQVYDPALGAAHVSDMLKEGQSLSESIAEQLEEDMDRETLLSAQDPQEIDRNDAQKQRTTGGVEFTNGIRRQGSANSGSPARDVNSSARSASVSARLPSDGSSSSKHSSAAQTNAAIRTSSAIRSKPTGAFSPVASPVVRGVPAAVLRAIEVEANIEAGSRNTAVTRNATLSRGRSTAVARSMGEAEARTLQGMTTLMAQRGGRMRVQLNPHQLGSVMIDVTVDGSRVEASIETANKSAMRLLEASTTRLKLSLESQGYSLDRIEIKHDPQSSATSEDSRSGSNPRHGHPDESDSDGRSRWDRMSRRRQMPNASNEEFNLSEQIGQEIKQ